MKITGKVEVSAITPFTDDSGKSQVDGFLLSDDDTVVGTFTLETTTAEAAALAVGGELAIGGSIEASGVFEPKKEEASTPATT